MSSMWKTSLKLFTVVVLAVILVFSFEDNASAQSGAVCGQLQSSTWDQDSSVFIPYNSNEVWSFVLTQNSGEHLWSLADLRPSNWEGKYVRVWDPIVQETNREVMNTSHLVFYISRWEFVSACEPAINFTVDRGTIAQGECTTLRWNVANVEAIYLDGSGTVGYGTKSVCPVSTTTYNLRVVSYIGNIDRSVTVSVVAPTPTPPLVPTATPSLSLPAEPSIGNINLPPGALGPTVTIRAGINLRKGPGTNYNPPLGATRSTATYALVGKDASGKWWLACCYQNQNFWVANYIGGVTAQGSLSNLPVVQPGETVPVGNTRAKQIRFSALGDQVTYFKVSGKNQYSVDKVWEQAFSTPLSIVETRDWWWQSTAILTFRTVNLGERTCIIESVDNGAQEPYVTITYSEGRCSGGGGGVAGSSQVALRAYLNQPEVNEVTDALAYSLDASECVLEIASGLEAIGGSWMGATMHVIKVGRSCGGALLYVVNGVLERLNVQVEMTSDATESASIQQSAASGAESNQSTLTNFESGGAWKRGQQTWGIFSQSTEQVYSGSYAGKIEYDFPAVGDNFVVFLQTISIPGQPSALDIWVYGDGSSNFLNAWVKDADGKGWQFTFGRVNHTGWQKMTAVLDPNAGWPNGPLDGQGGSPRYPLRFHALVLDGYDESKQLKGIIYVDELTAR